MIGLVLSPRFPFEMREQMPTRRDSAGGPNVQARRLSQQPFVEFSISLKYASEADADELLGFLAFHQGDTAMQFDGGRFGDLQQYIPIGIGNGTRTQFFVPRRNLLAPSWIFKVNDVITAGTVVESSGLVTLGAAPPANAQVKGMGRNWFKVICWSDVAAIRSMPGRVRETEEIVLREVA